MNYRFPIAERLKSPLRITEIFQKGKKVKHSFFLLLALPAEESVDRIAFSVPKRKINLAVNRNLIKRKLKEIYRLNKEALLIPESPQDYVLLYLGTPDVDYQKLEKAYLKLMEKWHNAASV